MSNIDQSNFFIFQSDQTLWKAKNSQTREWVTLPSSVSNHNWGRFSSFYFRKRSLRKWFCHQLIWGSNFYIWQKYSLKIWNIIQRNFLLKKIKSCHVSLDWPKDSPSLSWAHRFIWKIETKPKSSKKTAFLILKTKTLNIFLNFKKILDLHFPLSFSIFWCWLWMLWTGFWTVPFQNVKTNAEQL